MPTPPAHRPATWVRVRPVASRNTSSSVASRARPRRWSRSAFNRVGVPSRTIRGWPVDAGEVFGLFGPNGAGKSTTVQMLTTLLSITGRPRARRRRRRAARARRRAGADRRRAAGGRLDPRQTGRELLVLQGRLFDLSRARRRGARGRAARAGRAHRRGRPRIKGYSGGMKRRLDLASALVHEPEVLFLDEPTTGLDPASRLTVWDEVRRINERGTTVFLTTQYLEEADQLCDRLAIIDDGRIVREGTPARAEGRAARAPRARGRRRSTTCSSTRPGAPAPALPARCRR